MKEKIRNSNIELLRILVMFGIILTHISIKTGFVYPTNAITVNRLWIQILYMLGSMGNVCFILISGYFLIHKSNIEVKHIFKIWLQMFFYSFGITLLFMIFKIEEISIIQLLKSCLPVGFEFWWFASTYFIVYLLSPYINRLLQSFNQREFKKFLFLLLSLWSILPIFIPSTYGANELIFFIMIYSVGAYLGEYVDDYKSKHYFKYSMICIVSLIGSIVVMDIIGLKIPIFAIKYKHFLYLNELPMIVTCVFLFLGFKNLKIKNSKIINKIATTTFGIYLIHEHPLMRNVLNNFINSLQLTNSIYLIPLSLIIGLVIFIVCSCIDFMRIQFIEKKLFDKLYSKLENIEKKLLKIKKVLKG